MGTVLCIHYRTLGSIPGLCSPDPSSSLPSAVTPPMSSDVTQSPLVEGHCPWSHRSQIPWEFLFLSILPQDSISACVSHQVASHKWRCVHGSSCFRTSLSLPSLSCHHYPFTHAGGSWEQLATSIPVIDSYLKSISSLTFNPSFTGLKKKFIFIISHKLMGLIIKPLIVSVNFLWSFSTCTQCCLCLWKPLERLSIFRDGGERNQFQKRADRIFSLLS